jgi:hypothetical protein
VRRVSETSIEVRWNPIAFFQENGIYEIAISTNIDGPYQVIGQTTSKLITSFSVNDLQPNEAYFAQVRTYTFQHSNQANNLISKFSEPSIYINGD